MADCVPELRSLDELSALLVRLRVKAGSPSYAEIVRRIAHARDGGQPAKATVYDCFQPGRRRVDDALVADIARALGAAPEDVKRLRARARELNGSRVAGGVEISVGRRPIEGIVGRDDLVAAVSAGTGPAATGAAASVLVLSGLPGVGKSAVASLLAAGDETITVHLRESELGRAPLDPVFILRRMLAALGRRSAPYDLRRLGAELSTAAHGCTVILEDAAHTELIAPLIVPGLRYLITTRGRLDGLERLLPRSVSVPDVFVIPPLADDKAELLLRTLLGQSSSSTAITRIARVGSGLPRDLVAVAAQVHSRPGWALEDLAERFEGESRAARIGAVFDEAIAALHVDAIEVLECAATIGDEVELSVLESVVPLAQRAWPALVARHFAEVTSGRLRIHPVVFAVARSRAQTLRPVSERRAAAERAADAVLTAIERDPDYAAQHYASVLAVGRNAAEHGLDQVERIALAAHPPLAERGKWSESLAVQDLAISAARAHASGRPRPPLRVELNRAVCVEKLGRVDEALMILHTARRAASGQDEGRVWNQLASVHRRMGRFSEAIDEYLRAVELAHDMRDAVVEGRALGNRADTLRILGRYAEAAEGYDAALAVSRAADDRMNLGIVRTNRALLFVATGRLRDAEAELQEMVDAAGSRPVPHVLATLAIVAEAGGEDRITTQRLVAARLAAAGEYGSASELMLLEARLRARAGDRDAAARLAEQVLEDGTLAGSPLLITEAGNTLAGILVLLGDIPRARMRATAAEQLAEATGDRAERAQSRAIRAAAAERGGDRAGAAALRASARELYRSIGHRLGRDGAPLLWFEASA